MLTLELHKNKSTPLYMQIYSYIKDEVLSRRLKAGTKLPSKRALAAQLGISTITIEGAYGQLMAEGYIYAKTKSGYYVSPLENIQQDKDSDATFFRHSTLEDTQLFAQMGKNSITDTGPTVPQAASCGTTGRHQAAEGSTEYNALYGHNGCNSPTAFNTLNTLTDSCSRRSGHGIQAENACIDLSSNSILPENFPFSIWTKLMRYTMAENQTMLLTKSPTAGIYSLRRAIAEHLLRFRGMDVQPEQIIVGAGTEYLHNLLIQLLGNDLVYGVEDPGYHKIARIYESMKVRYEPVPLDQDGVSVQELEKRSVDIIHTSPSHHFPTGDRKSVV